eukprot:TRINITY_DN9336_c0_g1_i3.p2 TRINITY_DN9336_c0_g1~~TRINITY_DN9336_c0_g1_i3.p2  ORF type:complete len:116 (+),score=0.59 TRINITY_DN9336_c0_g1_i3:140-487(+)
MVVATPRELEAVFHNTLPADHGSCNTSCTENLVRLGGGHRHCVSCLFGTHHNSTMENTHTHTHTQTHTETAAAHQPEPPATGQVQVEDCLRPILQMQHAAIAPLSFAKHLKVSRP